MHSSYDCAGWKDCNLGITSPVTRKAGHVLKGRAVMLATQRMRAVYSPESGYGSRVESLRLTIRPPVLWPSLSQTIQRQRNKEQKSQPLCLIAGFAMAVFHRKLYGGTMACLRKGLLQKLYARPQPGDTKILAAIDSYEHPTFTPKEAGPFRTDDSSAIQNTARTPTSASLHMI